MTIKTKGDTWTKIGYACDLLLIVIGMAMLIHFGGRYYYNKGFEDGQNQTVFEITCIFAYAAGEERDECEAWLKAREESREEETNE